MISTSSNNDDEATGTVGSQRLAVAVVNKVSQHRVKELIRKSKLGDGLMNVRSYNYDEFDICKTLGGGSYGQVCKVRLALRDDCNKEEVDGSIPKHIFVESEEETNTTYNSPSRRRVEEKQHYALKRLNDATLSLPLSDPKKSKRLLSAATDIAMEAYILSQLNHENIVKVHGVAAASSSSGKVSSSSGSAAAAAAYNGNFFIMELLHEKTLKEWMVDWRIQEQLQQQHDDHSHHQPSNLLPMMKKHSHRINHVVMGIVNAMEYIHSHNILFRDLKAENIGFDRTTYQVKLFDFGSAKEIHLLQEEEGKIHKQCSRSGWSANKTKKKLLQQRVAGCTLRYMAPELFGYESSKRTSLSSTASTTTGTRVSARRSSNSSVMSASSVTSVTSSTTLSSVSSATNVVAAATASPYFSPYELSSDVYSFGVLLWELCTLEKAFEEYIRDVDLFRTMVHELHYRPPLINNGKTNNKDGHVRIKSKTFRRVIEQCWDPTPSSRPTFTQIKDALVSRYYEKKVDKEDQDQQASTTSRRRSSSSSNRRRSSSNTNRIRRPSSNNNSLMRRSSSNNNLMRRSDSNNSLVNHPDDHDHHGGRRRRSSSLSSTKAQTSKTAAYKIAGGTMNHVSSGLVSRWLTSVKKIKAGSGDTTTTTTGLRMTSVSTKETATATTTTTTSRRRESIGSSSRNSSITTNSSSGGRGGNRMRGASSAVVATTTVTKQGGRKPVRVVVRGME